MSDRAPSALAEAVRQWEIGASSSTPMRLVLATRNPGKVAELAARLDGLGVELVTAASLDAPTVEEDADTLAGNAAKKAQSLWRHTGTPALADDTGLEVDALGGAPGVHSARFAGSDANDQANREKLLAELDGAETRAARFRTVLAYVDADGLRTFDGVCQGVITAEEHGDAGFGYDSVFRPSDSLPPAAAGGDGRTFAQMSADEKNRISHRGRALEAFTAWFEARTATP